MSYIRPALKICVYNIYQNSIHPHSVEGIWMYVLIMEGTVCAIDHTLKITKNNERKLLQKEIRQQTYWILLHVLLAGNQQIIQVAL